VENDPQKGNIALAFEPAYSLNDCSSKIQSALSRLKAMLNRREE